MTQMTHLSHTVEKTEYASKYDAAAKKLVSDKQVLARIVKGTAKEKEEKCDFLSVIIIRLSGKDNSDSNNELIDMLTVLLSEEIDAETKKRELETKHGMTMTKEVEGGIRSMCNLGEGLIEKYEKRGEERGLRNLVETCQELNQSKETTILKLMEKYQLERKDAEAKIEAYWKE